MTGIESPDYQIARDRIKGNLVVTQMAASVATVPAGRSRAMIAAPAAEEAYARIGHAGQSVDPGKRNAISGSLN